MASIHLDADSENAFFSIISDLIIALGFQNGSEREFDLNLEEENGNKLEFSLENEFSPKSTVIPIKNTDFCKKLVGENSSSFHK